MKVCVLVLIGLSVFSAEVAYKCASDRVQMSLDLFEPIAKFVSGIDKPASQAVASFYERENACSHTDVSVWKTQGEPADISDLLVGLRKLQAAWTSDTDRASFDLPGLLAQVNMGGALVGDLTASGGKDAYGGLLLGYLAPKLSMGELFELLKQASGMKCYRSSVALLIWHAIKNRFDQRVDQLEPAFQYLKFLVMQEGLSNSYAKSELDKVSQYLCNTYWCNVGAKKSAEEFLTTHCGSCESIAQMELLAYAGDALQRAEQDVALTESSVDDSAPVELCAYHGAERQREEWKVALTESAL